MKVNQAITINGDLVTKDKDLPNGLIVYASDNEFGTNQRKYICNNDSVLFIIEVTCEGDDMTAITQFDISMPEKERRIKGEK